MRSNSTVLKILCAAVVYGLLLPRPSFSEEPAHPVQLTEPQGSLVFRVVPRSPQKRSEVDALTVDPGSQDEVAEGPASFDVLPDSRYVISDPLASRLVFYTKDGKYEKELKLEFSPDRVSNLPDRRLQIRDAKTDTVYRFNEANGLLQQRGKSRGLAEPGNNAEAQLVGPHLGVIKRPATRGAASGEIQVAFNSAGKRLVSLGSLEVEDTGVTYVVFDSDHTGASVSAEKTIREYLPDGTFDLEVANIENDAVVRPIDEFRVRNGRLYQLVTQQGVVKINFWTLKSAATH